MVPITKWQILTKFMVNRCTNIFFFIEIKDMHMKRFLNLRKQ